jgi:hypothetical protein
MRLRRLGKTRRWLAEATGYRFESLRDAFAPNSKRGISAKMAAELEAVLAKAEAEMPPAAGDLLGEFTAAERRAMAEHASREGYPGPHSWVVAKLRALLVMMGATKPKR